jgi:cytochrome c oxidase assembly protein subunit 15
VVQQAEGFHKYIEFGNRLLTYVLAAAALAAAILVWRHVSRGFGDRRLRRLGVVPFAGIPLQAVIGGVSVLTDLNPWVVMLHLLASMAMVAVSTWLLLAVNRTVGPPAALSIDSGPVRSEVRLLAAVTGAVSAVVLVLGTIVTGSGPHSGDTDVTHRFGFDPRTVSWLHADAVWLFVGLVLALALALRLTGAPATARRRTLVLLGVTLAQGVVGYVQYFTGVPAVLVGVHMLGAAVLVVAVTATVEGVVVVQD